MLGPARETYGTTMHGFLQLQTITPLIAASSHLSCRIASVTPAPIASSVKICFGDIAYNSWFTWAASYSETLVPAHHLLLCCWSGGRRPYLMQREQMLCPTLISDHSQPRLKEARRL